MTVFLVVMVQFFAFTVIFGPYLRTIYLVAIVFFILCSGLGVFSLHMKMKYFDRQQFLRNEITKANFLLEKNYQRMK